MPFINKHDLLRMGFEPISVPYEGTAFTIKPTKYGGPDATRTRYLLLARQVLSQLSYWPILMPRSGRVDEAI